MAKFLTTSGISHYIENIIIEARTKIVLVSPYLKLGKTLHERLKDATNQNVAVKIIFGKNELKPNEKNSLAELKNIELFYFENLHAKCYLNENHMIITSMNMYEFSEKTNRKMGVLINRTQDKELFENAINEILSIIQSAEPVQLKKTERELSSSPQRFKKKLRGYCIRCEGRLEYNPEKPYCEECYSVWAQYSNADYTENVCHRCGEYSETSMNKPQDKECFNLWKKELKENESTSLKTNTARF